MNWLRIRIHFLAELVASMRSERRHKTGSPLVVWTVDGFNEFTEPVHVRLTVDDPTTSITVSIDVLTDPRHFQRPVPDL